MTKVSKRQLLPALDNSKSVQNPDLLNIANKNYTSTILRYSNLAILFSQLDTESKTIVGAINELKKDVPYVLPPATKSTLGGVIVGENLNITDEGVLSSTASGIEPATTDTLGGIIVGDYLNVTEDGTLSVDSSAVGKTYYSGTLTTIDNARKINVNMTKSYATDIEQESKNNPNVLYYTEGVVPPNMYTREITLSASSWSDNVQPVSVLKLTEDSTVIVAPAPTYLDTYSSCGIYAYSQGIDVLYFGCAEVPESDIQVNVVFWEYG